MQAQTSENKNTIHQRRRRQRNREDIWSVLSEAPAPFGTSAPSHYREISSWTSGHDGGLTPWSLDWSRIPPSCEPCALLNNPANRGKKHGKTVLEQLDLIQFCNTASVESPSPETVSRPSSVPIVSPQDKRGMQKRWQVMPGYES